MSIRFPVWARAGRRSAHLTALALAGVLATGCHEYVPVSSFPTGKPQTVEVLLNERGRADFVNRLGPDALHFVGTLVNRKDTTFTVRVQEVTYINRSTTQWSGESVDVTDGQVRDVRARRIARGKTFLAVASGGSAILLFILTRTLGGGGNTNTSGPNPPPNPS
jgi:hypothetical protein